MEVSRIVSVKEVYASLVQLIIQAESITWDRFNNFLLFNSILTLAWATLWAGGGTRNVLVLGLFCILGAVSGVFWAALGYRGREFLKLYVELAKSMESDEKVWPSELEKYKRATMEIELRDKVGYGWAGSKYLLTGCPLLVTGLYVVLFAVSISGCF